MLMEIPLLTVLNDHVRGNSDQAAVCLFWLLACYASSLFQGQTQKSEVVGTNSTHLVATLVAGENEKIQAAKMTEKSQSAQPK